MSTSQWDPWIFESVIGSLRANASKTGSSLKLLLWTILSFDKSLMETQNFPCNKNFSGFLRLILVLQEKWKSTNPSVNISSSNELFTRNKTPITSHQVGRTKRNISYLVIGVNFPKAEKSLAKISWIRSSSEVWSHVSDMHILATDDRTRECVSVMYIRMYKNLSKSITENNYLSRWLHDTYRLLMGTVRLNRVTDISQPKINSLSQPTGCKDVFCCRGQQ